MISVFKNAMAFVVLAVALNSAALAQRHSASPFNAQVGRGDWPQMGGTPARNNAPDGTNIPVEWDVETGRNIKWSRKLGSETYGSVVVANGKLYVGTNNEAEYLKRYPSEIDLGVLLCFRESDGEFLWQHSSEKLPTGREHDMPNQGLCSSPVVEGDRLWFVTNRGEVVCLDAEGFYDDEDDGPLIGIWQPVFEVAIDLNQPDNRNIRAGLDESQMSQELRLLFASKGIEVPEDAKPVIVDAGKSWTLTTNTAGISKTFRFIRQGTSLVCEQQVTSTSEFEADTVWSFNMMNELGVSQHNMATCSPTIWGDVLFICTSNGVDQGHFQIPAPDAPSFMAMDKHTGKVLWTDNSPGKNILHGQWSSPAVGVFNGVPQVLFAGGDGWLYSFRADRSKDGKPELLWKFDGNPKDSIYSQLRSTRSTICAVPVVYDGLVYLAMGDDPELGEAYGNLWCIDPAKLGDVSPELVVDQSGNIVPHQRIQATAPIGDVRPSAIPNPNSAVVWRYDSYDQNNDGKIEFEETMHRSLSSPVIKDNLLIISEMRGLLHCLNAKTGKPYWTHDLLSACWTTPLIVGETIYAADTDGDIAILPLSIDPNPPAKVTGDARDFQEPMREMFMANSICAMPVVANNVLYIATRNRLFAIAAEGAPNAK